MSDKTSLRRPVMVMPWCWAIDTNGVAQPVIVQSERLAGGSLRVTMPAPPPGWTIKLQVREAMTHEA